METSKKKKMDVHKFVQDRTNSNREDMLADRIITDINVRDPAFFNGTALIHDAYHGKLDGMSFLLTHKQPADPNLQDYCGDTALHWAVLTKDTARVQLLLVYGADYKIKNNRGKTPLDFAKKYKCLECINVLKTHRNKRKLMKTLEKEEKAEAKVQSVLQVMIQNQVLVTGVLLGLAMYGVYNLTSASLYPSK